MGRVFTRADVPVDTRDMSAGQRTLVACLLGAALWNSVCMVPMVVFSFKRYWTLYFWMILVSNSGVLICAVEQIMSIARPSINPMLIAIMALCGWPLMATGQSLVLYSRLHLLFFKERTLRLVLGMIVFNGVVIHCAGWVLTIGFHLAQRFARPYR